MAKVAPIQVNFNAGEVSPLMYGRVDFDKYKNALSICLNMIPLVQGAITRRPGTQFAGETKNSAAASRIYGFKYSTTQAYVIEFGDLYARFYRNNGPVLEATQVLTGATAANPVVITYVGADPSNGDHIEIASVVGMTELNARRFKVANVNAGANTLELQDLEGNAINGAAYTAYVSGGTMARVYTVVTPYAVADVPALKFAQSADVLYVAHPSYAPRKISRTGHTAWTVTTIDFVDGPYLPTNSTPVQFTCSATVGAATLTATSSTFAATDVGRHFRVKTTGAAWGWGKITAYTSGTQVTVDIIKAVGATTATVDWRLGLWSATTGYPTCVTFHEDRLGWGGSTAAPQRIDLSRTGSYETMQPTDYDTSGTVAADHALSFTLNSEDVQVIKWMQSDEQGLLVGTVAGEWIVRPSSLNEALTPTNVKAVQMTGYGSTDNIRAVRCGKAALFVQRAGRKLRELSFVYVDNAYRAPDRTVLSQHITRGGLKETAYQQEPQSLLWGVRNDGVLTGFTYEPNENVLGWHRHILGGAFSGGDAVVESVASIPAADGTRDEVWLLVKRTINGVTRRYVEYMTKLWERGDDQEDAFYVDCGLTYDGAATRTIGGLWHMVGETVTILADGATHPTKVVSALGKITLDRDASVVHVGYGYNSDMATLRNDAGAADGTAQGKTQRAHAVAFRLHDTLGMMAGATFNTSGAGKLTRQVFRHTSDLLGVAVPLFSGDHEMTWEGDYTTENLVCVRFDQPLPGTILAVMPRQMTIDR